MADNPFITVEIVKQFNHIPLTNTNYDDDIEFFIPRVCQKLLSKLNLFDITKVDTVPFDIQDCACADIGCKLIRRDPELGKKLRRYQLKGTEVEFEPDKTATGNICDEYKDLYDEVMNIYADTIYVGSAKRPGMNDDYEEFY